VATELQQVKIAIKFGTGDLNPHHFGHPAFFAYMLFAVYGAIFVVMKILGLLASAADFGKLYFTDPYIFFLTARIAVLLFASLGMVILYKIGLMLFNRTSAILAALFIAVSPVFIKSAHYASPDIPLFFFSMASFYFSARVFKEGKMHDYICAGVLAGLAIGSKYNGLLLVVPIITGHLLGPAKGPVLKKVFDKRLIASGICVALAFFISNPFAILDYKTFIGGTGVAGSGLIKEGPIEQIISAKGYHFASFKNDKPGWLYVFTDTIPSSVGMPLAILIAAGIFHMLYRRRREDILILILLVAAYAIMGGWNIIKPRYFINIIPFMLLATADFLSAVLSKISGTAPRRLSLCILFPLLLAAPLVDNIKYDVLVSRRPVYAEMKEWVESNVLKGSGIATFVGMPLYPNAKSISRKLAEIDAKKIGQGKTLKEFLKHQDWFKVTYDIIELPYPWREDYDEGDFDFDNLVKNEGIKFFILTQEAEEYYADPVKYEKQVKYLNAVKEKCVLLKEFRKARPKFEPGFISDDEYAQVYRYKY